MSDQNDGPVFAEPVMKREFHVPREKYENEGTAEEEEKESTGNNDLDEDAVEEPIAGELELRRSQRARQEPNYYGEWANSAKLRTYGIRDHARCLSKSKQAQVN